MRFLFLKPKVGADLDLGLATPALTTPKVLPFTVPAFPGEALVELFAFSDCKTWYALNVHLWHPGLENVTAKAAGFVKKDDEWVRHALHPDVLSPLPGLTFFDFVKLYMKHYFVEDLLDLLPSHPVSLALAGFVPPPKKVEPVVPPAEVFVPAAPLNLENLKLPPGDFKLDKRVASHTVHTVKHSPAVGEHTVLRFVHMVPKLGADLSGGLVSPGLTTPRLVPLTLPECPGEALVELVAFSDCKTWFALNLEFWLPRLDGTVFRAAGFVKGDHGFERVHLFPGAALPFKVPTHTRVSAPSTVVDFVHEHVPAHFVKNLFEKLPSHVVVLGLKDKWKLLF
ncbi:hypothetical protein MACK_003435 [Theileria orientalis]|uniref:Uncharacterized protein n=1 Tax=Theileria orientalis TaxID=68886 RepID=A0A976SIQ6_THEOR|nr:hypothetical protein MACK_003435 [Theileria orientalis]